MTIPFAVDTPGPKERIQEFIDKYRATPEYQQGFDGPLMHSLKLLSATASTNPKEGDLTTAIFELDVTPQFCNPMGNMHGGAVALAVDMCTSMAIAPISTPDFWHFGGVSRTLNVTYLRPIKGGEKVLIEASLKGIGKRLSTLQCSFRSEDGTLLALGEHGKAALDLNLQKPETKI